MCLYIYACRILVWEDGFCNFAASAAPEINSGDCSTPPAYGNCEFQPYQGLQPELFFKMSHEIYNYGEGYAILINIHLHYLVSRALHAHLEFENINLMLYQSILLKLKIRGRFFWLSYKNVIPLNLVSLFVTVWSVFFLHCCLKSFYSNMM